MSFLLSASCRTAGTAGTSVLAQLFLFAATVAILPATFYWQYLRRHWWRLGAGLADVERQGQYRRDFFRRSGLVRTFVSADCLAVGRQPVFGAQTCRRCLCGGSTACIRILASRCSVDPDAFAFVCRHQCDERDECSRSLFVAGR